MCLEIGIQCPHIAPVAFFLIGLRIGHHIGCEVVCKHPMGFGQSWKHMVAEICLAQFMHILHGRPQQIRLEEIVTHGRIGVLRIVRHGLRLLGFLLKIADSFRRISFDNAEV